ncbi:MAG: tyrosine-type recombinase/integrase [Bacteroidetes bacterium]|nr:tyrosine-type recombinase/integrase [Bacteroidota bacterium]
MSLIGQRTKSDFIEWEKLQSLTQKLERDGDWKFCTLITVSMFSGLRIGDLLTIRWNDLLGKDHLEIIEKKTGKTRKILINQQLRETIGRISTKLPGIEPTDFIFLNRWNTKPISPQFVNWKLKFLMKKYEVVKDTTKIKSHSIRKSFGRRVWENSERSEKGLIMLNEIFNHTSIKTTKIYLGIREKELFDVYQNL